MRKTKLLAFSLTVAMLLSVLLVPVNAFVLVETENYSGLTDENITANILNPETIGKNYKESAWGPSTIDGVMDENDAYVKGSYTMPNLGHKQNATNSTDTEYHLWYSNDDKYLYFYIEVDGKDSEIQSGELARLHLDFYNQHKLDQYAKGDDYTNFVNGAATYAGGVLEFKAYEKSYRDYKGKIKTNHTTEAVITANGGKFMVEGKIELPNFITVAITAGNQPVIGAGQEVRTSKSGTMNCLGYFDTTGYDSMYESDGVKDYNEFVYLYNNHTILPDLVLATSTSTLKNSEVSEQVTITAPITLDAERKGEGWADIPYLKLDRLTNGITGKAGEKGSVDVYVSTDGENLYLFYESPVAIDEARGMIQLSDEFFRTDKTAKDIRDWFVYFKASDAGNGVEYTFWYRTNDTYTSEDGTRFGQITAVHNDDKTVWEMKIPLPNGSYNKIDGYDNNIVEQLKNGDVTIKFNAFIKNSGNGYYHSSLYSTTDWNRAHIPLTIPKAPSNSNIVVEGLQERVEDDGLTDVRFLASLKGDYKGYEALGFEFAYGESTATAECRYVYTGIKAGEKLITPDLYEADFFFCYTLYNLEAGDYTFTVRSWSQKTGESKSYSEATVFDITVEEDGSVTVKK